MSVGERWNKKFAESLTKDEKKSLQTLARLFQGKRRAHLESFTFNCIGVSIGPLLADYTREVRTLFRGNHREGCNRLR